MRNNTLWQHMEENMLQIKKLTIIHRKDNRVLMQDVSFSLNAGDKLAIIGEEGNGKSSLLKLIYDESLVDEYLDYISVPVNLMTGEAIAAGVVEMEYSGLTFVGFETGRLLKEMAANYATDGIVRMAGNAENEDQEVFADGIYANLRFVKPGNTDPNTLIEMPEDADFANWEEREFAITPIIQY